MAASDPTWGQNTLLRGPALRRLGPAILVVALLACVLVPLPTPLVDLLLSLSLSGAVVLLVASLGIRRPTEFFAFPQLLLLATLFRLALNLSTTRLILSQADAGKVIDAFAGFVVRGDMVVGGVMFLIITVVQFVVIAQGSERVAEVAARFALDALPGHQAAIDADLRAGALTARQAAERRAALADRSSFFGAMDGTIRFVRGDAIAGLVVTGVNLLGGLAIGVGRMNYGWGESLDVYGRLTIGDGLLAQIPALLVSLAAGVLVSRVDRSASGRAPVWLEPGMLYVPAALLVFLSAVPAMPALPFLTTAVGLVTVGVVLGNQRRREAPARAAGPRLVVTAPPDVVQDGRGGRSMVEEVRRRCEDALGIPVPPVVLEIAASSREMTVTWGRRDLDSAPVDGDSPADGLILFTFRAIMDHADQLVDLERVDQMVEELRVTHPVVVRTASQKVSLGLLLAVVRGLLRERVPVPPIDEVLGVLMELPSQTPPHDALERVRTRLAPHWVPAVLSGLGPRASVAWSRPLPDSEETIIGEATPTDAGWVLQVSPTRAQALQAALLGDAQAPVVVTTPRARAVFAQLVRGVTPHVYVVSAAELGSAGAPVPADARWVDLDDDDA